MSSNVASVVWVVRRGVKGGFAAAEATSCEREDGREVSPALSRMSAADFVTLFAQMWPFSADMCGSGRLRDLYLGQNF